MEHARIVVERVGEVVRVEIDSAGMIDGPADQVWALATHWSGLQAQMARRPGPRQIASSELMAGQTEQDLPRTRLLRLAPPFDHLEPLAETLLHADDQRRTAYYAVEGQAMAGMFNYLCYMTVDALPDGRSLLRFNSRFDASDETTGKAIGEGLMSAHRDGIMAGFRMVLAGRDPRA